MVPVVEMTRLRQQERDCDWLFERVVTPARAISAMRRMMIRLVLLARLVLVAPAKTAIARAMVRACETVIDLSPWNILNCICGGDKFCENAKNHCLFVAKAV